MRPLFLIFLAVALSGCAIFTSPKEQPVIEDRSSNWFNMEKVGVLSTTAERREVIFKFPGNKFCAEPPPDVAEALSSNLTMLLQGSASNTATAGEVTARLEAAKTLATSIRPLFRRSQGSQFLRDGLFHLCQAYLNDAIDKEQYVAMYQDLLTRSQCLIEREIPLMPPAMQAEDAAANAASSEAVAKAAALQAEASAQRAKKAADDSAAVAAKKTAAPTQ